MKEDKLNIRRNCKWSVSRNYPKTPKQFFQEMADFVEDQCYGDVYGAGEELEEFEKSIAQKLGHEAALFLPSGTMAQLIAMRIWTDEKKNPLIGFHETSHLELHEQNAYAALHSLNAIHIGEKHRVINLDDLKKLDPMPACVLLELPSREIGGQLPSWDNLLQQVEYLKSEHVRVHMDGARLWECLPFYNVSATEIGKLFDSVYVSFYKGLEGLSGAALTGSKDFIKAARVWNRRHGGNLVTQYPAYISSRCGLETKIDRFSEYWKKTQEIAEGLSKIPNIRIVPEKPQVNMFHLHIKGEKSKLIEKALQVSKDTGVWIFGDLQNTDDADEFKFEWYVGSCSLDLDTSTIIKIINQILC